MSANTEDASPMVMTLELAREDNPRLFDDLLRFRKGVKRINRLRYLAHEGLLAQQWVAGSAGLTQVERSPARVQLAELFEPPVPS